MARSREQVEHGPAVEFVTAFDQTGCVAPERRWITTHEDEDARFSGEQRIDTPRPQTITGRIGDHDSGIRCTPAFDTRPNDASVDIGKVDPSVCDRVTAALDRRDRSVTMQRSREQSDPGVRVDQGAVRGVGDHRSDLVDECVSAGGPVLKERIGGDAESMASDDLVDPRPLSFRQFPPRHHPNIIRHLDFEGRPVDDNKSIAGAVADTNDDRARARIPTLDQKLFGAGIDCSARVRDNDIV